MGLIAIRNAVLALPKRYDARLELGGLPAVTALLVAWPISVALIVAVRFASFGEISLLWAPPWIALPLFWPALVLLPIAAHIPTKLIPLVFAIGGLTADRESWLPLVTSEANLPWRSLIRFVNSGAIDVLPPITYGCIIGLLMLRRNRSGSTDMHGFRPYRAAILSLLFLVIIWFVIPFLILALSLTPTPRVPDAGGIGVFLGIIMGGLVKYFPWSAIIAGVVTISMTHGIPRPYVALVFLAVALALCPLDSSLSSVNLLTVALKDVAGMPSLTSHTLFTADTWRPLFFNAVGLVNYGFSLWLTRRRAAKSRSALGMLISDPACEAAGSR